MELWALWCTQSSVKWTRTPSLASGWWRQSQVEKWVVHRCPPASSRHRPCRRDLPLIWWNDVQVFSVLRKRLTLVGGCSVSETRSWSHVACSRELMPGFLVPDCAARCVSLAGLAACHDVFQGSWSWAEATGWILTTPVMEVLWWWKHIMCCFDDEANLACCHFPQLFAADLSLLHTFPLHPLPLFGKRHRLGTSCSLLLSAHLPNHQCPPLWCCGQVGLLAIRQKPPLPCWTHPTMSLCLRADVAYCTVSDGVHFQPVVRVQQHWWSDLRSPSVSSGVSL